MSFAQEEIVELFEDAQENCASAVARAAIRDGLSVRGLSPKTDTPHRKEYARAFTAKVKHEQIRDRILAGERPKTGGPGRPPTRWWRVANELGIDIGQPKAVTP